MVQWLAVFQLSKKVLDVRSPEGQSSGVESAFCPCACVIHCHRLGHFCPVVLFPDKYKRDWFWGRYRLSRGRLSHPGGANTILPHHVCTTYFQMNTRRFRCAGCLSILEKNCKPHNGLGWSRNVGTNQRTHRGVKASKHTLVHLNGDMLLGGQ